MTTGLDTFKDVVKDFRSIGGLVTKGAIALPLVDLFLEFGPPWPKASWILAGIVELLVLITVFEYWYRSPRYKLRRRMGAFMVGFLVIVTAFLFLDSELVHSDPSDGRRVVGGFNVRSEVTKVRLPGQTDKQLLKEANYEPETVWTRRSITAARLSLLGSWLAAFACLAAAIAIFVTIQRQRVTPQPQPPAQTPRRAAGMTRKPPK